MSILLIGTGRIGSTILKSLVEKGLNVVVLSRSSERSREIKEEYDVPVVVGNALSKHLLEDIVVKYGIKYAFTALPGRIAFNVIKSLVEIGVNVVDVSYYPQDIFTLDELAKRKNVIVVPDAGIAPGLSNILAGRIYSEMELVDSIEIYVGGLAKDREAPLGLVATWSIDDLLDEYTRPARIIENGEVRTVDPLSITGTIRIPGLGMFEYFVSDGLRTMVKTLREVRKLVEYTIRYPGHINVMKELRKLGLLSEKEIQIGNTRVNVRNVIVKVLEESLSKNIKDRVILYVKGVGVKNGTSRVVEYLVHQEYDEKEKITAMAKTTAYSFMAIADMIIKGKIDYNGVYPPEYIGMDRKLYEHIVKSLLSKGIEVIEVYS